MGLPRININFFGLLQEGPKRSAAGVVALLLRDDTQTGTLFSYKKGDEPEGWTTENLDYIQLALKGEPKEVIVARVDATEGYLDGLNRLKNKRFNYLAIPNIPEAEAETEAVAAWIRTKRDVERKKFKAVLPNAIANDESIINLTAKDIVMKDGKEYTTAEFTARIAGILAGLSFNRSATYYVLDDVESVFEVENPDAAIDNGELILINDGENIKIGRGVNSLTTIKPEDKKNDDFKSIRVVEIMDMIHDEIYNNFSKNYVGKVPNTYDNQVLFLNEVIQGFGELEALDLLDSYQENTAWIDADAQRAAWEAAGTDTSTWDDQRVKENAFKRHIYLAGKVRIVDTIEDLEFNIEI